MKRLSGEIVELKQHLEHYDKVQELTQMLQESHRCGRGGEWGVEPRQGRVQELTQMLQESHRFRGGCGAEQWRVQEQQLLVASVLGPHVLLF